MKIHAAEPLFAWAELEDFPSLGTLRAFLDTRRDVALGTRTI